MDNIKRFKDAKYGLMIHFGVEKVLRYTQKLYTPKNIKQKRP